MCNTCFDASNREDISSLSRLAEVVGGMDNVRFREGYEAWQIADMKATGNSCLCPVNVIETLVFNGFKVWEDPEDTVWRGFFFEPITTERLAGAPAKIGDEHAPQAQRPEVD